MCYVLLPPELDEAEKKIQKYRRDGEIPEDAPYWVKRADQDIAEYYRKATTGPNGEPLM